MLKNTNRILLVIMLAIPTLWYSCTKVAPAKDEPATEQIIDVASRSAPIGDTQVTIRTNTEIINAIKTGVGGWASNGGGRQRIFFPSYAPPVKVGNMLSFPSQGDYQSFLIAMDLMGDAWNYSMMDYEDTPDEINHLGEEYLDAFDSAFAFSSLRHKYEVYDYYNHNWEDTASINVEDDDFQTVMNSDYEVKIGDKYLKFVASNLVAVVSNNDLGLLDKVRNKGWFIRDPNLLYYDDETGKYVTPAVLTRPLGGCNDFDLYAYANNLTPQSTTDRWTVDLGFAGYYSTANIDNRTVMAEFTIEWGDGFIETFTDLYYYPARRTHLYMETVTPGNSVTKFIRVAAHILNPTATELFYCSDPGSVLITQKAVVTLTHPAPVQCLWGHFKRKFNGVEQYAGSTKYRLECKMVAKTSPFSPLATPKIKIKGTFTKWKNNRWKKTTPVTAVILKLRGDVYNTSECDLAIGTCTGLFKRLDEVKVTTKQKSIKLKVNNLPCFTTNRIMPYAINADFIWTHNNGQTAIGNYNEVLKP